MCTRAHECHILFYLKRLISPQDCENSETEKLLQFSKQDAGSEEGPGEDEEDGLVVADYESDEESIRKTKCVVVCVWVYVYECLCIL